MALTPLSTIPPSFSSFAPYHKKTDLRRRRRRRGKREREIGKGSIQQLFFVRALEAAEGVEGIEPPSPPPFSACVYLLLPPLSSSSSSFPPGQSQISNFKFRLLPPAERRKVGKSMHATPFFLPAPSSSMQGYYYPSFPLSGPFPFLLHTPTPV